MSNSNLAKKVFELRKSKGFSQEALAEITGLSIRTIQRIEKENKIPSGETLKRLAEALGVSIDYLIEWETEENTKFLLYLVLSPILFILNSFLSVIIPLVLWILKKDVISNVKTLGIKVIRVQIIWLLCYYFFRTINFYRIQHAQNNTVLVEDEFNDMLLLYNSQIYLKVFFTLLNICIILFMTYKTYKKHSNN